MFPDYSALCDKAAELRRRAGLINPSFSTRAIIASSFPDLVVTGRRLPPGIEEIVARTIDGPIIIYSRDLSGPKQRYVIAHALAHLLFDGADTSCGPGHVGDPACEARANAFADELLVPLDWLSDYVSVRPGIEGRPCHERYLDQCDEIASRFNVPRHVVDRRTRQVFALGTNVLEKVLDDFA